MSLNYITQECPAIQVNYNTHERSVIQGGHTETHRTEMDVSHCKLLLDENGGVRWKPFISLETHRNSEIIALC